MSAGPELGAEAHPPPHRQVSRGPCFTLQEDLLMGQVGETVGRLSLESESPSLSPGLHTHELHRPGRSVSLGQLGTDVPQDRTAVKGEQGTRCRLEGHVLDRAALTAVPGLLPGGPRPTKAKAGAGVVKMDPARGPACGWKEACPAPSAHRPAPRGLGPAGGLVPGPVCLFFRPTGAPSQRPGRAHS